MILSRKKKDQPISLGEKLRSVRDEQKLGNLKVAGAALGCSNNTLASYERGEVLPDVDFLAKFAEVTGIPFLELLALRLVASGQPESLRAIESLQEALSTAPHLEMEAMAPESAREVDGSLLTEISLRLVKRMLETLEFGVAAVRFYAEQQVAIREVLKDVRDGKVAETEAFLPLIRNLQSTFLQTVLTISVAGAAIYNGASRRGTKSARTRFVNDQVESFVDNWKQALGDRSPKDQPDRE